MRWPIRRSKRDRENAATAAGSTENVHDAQKVRGAVISGRVLTVLLISLPVAFVAMFLIWLYFAGTHAPPAPKSGWTPPQNLI